MPPLNKYPAQLRGEVMKLFDGRVSLHGGDCLEVLKTLPDSSIDACVTDPPYHLTSIVKRFGGANAAACKEGTDGSFARLSRGFMGKQWDGGDIAFRPELWAEVLRVLKPGGHMVAFSGTRTYHRMACAIEDAGFEIRDMIQWVYGSGFPKSHNVGKGIDKEATGAAKQWDGWGTALKPANEPLCFARKPLSEKTVAANVLKWGTGAINIGGCRVEMGAEYNSESIQRQQNSAGAIKGAFGAASLIGKEIPTYNKKGRWPANLIHDGSDEVLAGFPDTDKSGSAARFFYCAKASKAERGEGNKHPTVKPLKLMQYLCRLITPPGGVVLDPFAGSGTTGLAAASEGFSAVLIEREAEYQEMIAKRMERAMANCK